MNITSIINKFIIYQYMISFLTVLIISSALLPMYPFGAKSLYPVLIAVITTVTLDLLIEYFKLEKNRISNSIFFPYSALITGLLIGGLLTQNLQWYVYVIAGIVAIGSKHLLKFNQKHIFNPANFGILLMSIFFGAAHTWWASSPIILVLIFGIFIIWRLRRFDLVLSFLLSYYLINSIIELSKGNGFSDVYSTIINGGVIFFFSMFMLIEPKTNPSQRKQRIAYGIFVAVLLIVFSQYPQFYKNSFATFFERHSIPLALAVGNVFVLVLNKKYL